MATFDMGLGCAKCGKKWTKRNVAHFNQNFVFLCSSCNKKLDKVMKDWLKQK
jgi:DNA-directed RNA polymerase subunit RPC12/RpoP